MSIRGCLQELIGPDPQVSVRHQCELLDLCRGTYYYQCAPETEENLALMRRLDELHLAHPVYGSRKLTVSLRREGVALNRKRVVRLLRLHYNYNHEWTRIHTNGNQHPLSSRAQPAE